MVYQNLNLGLTVTAGELNEPSARSLTARAVAQAKKMQIKVEALMITDEVAKAISENPSSRMVRYV
jgi:hypothetical protein